VTTAAFMLIATALVLYAVLAGADAGTGLWLLLGARGDLQPALLSRFSPVWEVNGLFLIFALTGLFASFPQALGTLGAALIPLYLPVLLLIPTRGASYTLLHHRSKRVRRLALVVFAWSSLGIGLLIGYATLALPAGIVGSGAKLDRGYFSSLASLASLPFLILGIAYAGASATRDRRLVNAATWSGAGWLLTIPPYAYALARANPSLRHHLLGPDAAPILIGFLVVLTSLFVQRRRHGLGRAISAAGCAAIGLAVAAATLPYLAYPAIRTPNHAGPSLHAYVLASLVGGPLLLLFLGVLYGMVGPQQETATR
jgi:cytochrome bd ubiquinol oxidase subunit II